MIIARELPQKPRSAALIDDVAFASVSVQYIGTMAQLTVIIVRDPALHSLQSAYISDKCQHQVMIASMQHWLHISVSAVPYPALQV